MRDLPATIEAGFATDSQALARCAVLVLRDGQLLAFTDADEDVAVDLGGTLYNVTCRADLGLEMGNIELVAGPDASNTEVTVPLVDTVSLLSALGRRYNQATAYIFDVDYTATEPLQPLELLKGWVAETRIPQNTVVLEVRNFADLLNMVQGRLLAPRCTATYGDEQCGVAVVDVPAVVTGVISDMRFTVDLAGTLENHHFRFGEGEFTSGELLYTPPFEVWDYEGSSGMVKALAPLPGIPQVGDTLALRIGCSKLKILDENPSIPTCRTNNNCRRFRGFDRVPGSDVYLRVPIPGEG